MIGTMAAEGGVRAQFYFGKAVFETAFSSLSLRHQEAPSGTVPADGVRQVKYNCSFL